jgi:molybdate-binding protein/DNA-binding XRE family transcriptional regulator
MSFFHEVRVQSVEVQSNLAQFRAKRAISAIQLAAEAGVSRQTIHSIESGLYVPNTVVSLKLARILDTTVEELFRLEAPPKAIEETAEVHILGWTASLPKGQPLRLATVNEHLVAVAPDPASWGLQPTDAVYIEPFRTSKGSANAKVRLLSDSWKNPGRILLAGCDPSASLLAHSLERQGFELIIAYENSSRALDLLHEGLVHVAGTHLAERAGDKADLLPITKMFPRNSIAILSYAMWKEGLVVAEGNPKKIAGIADLARKDVYITNREPGAGCRRLLDDLLKAHGIASSKVKGYDRSTLGQLPAARLVQSGEVDCCISTQAAALTLGLTFLPLAEKPYLLVLRRAHLALPPVEALVGMLGRSAFRREVESCVGYDMRKAGNRLV